MLIVLGGDIIFARVKDQLEEPTGVVDVGTGTIWAIEVGDMHPNTHVYGFDYRPNQPSFVPPNVECSLDDVEQDWLLDELCSPRRTINYVHARDMTLAVKDRPKFLGQTFKCVEFQIPTESNNTKDWKHWVSTIPCPTRVGCCGWSKTSGFEGTTEKFWKIPIGGWCANKRLKEVGNNMRLILSQGAQAIAETPLAAGQGWSPERVLELVASFREGLGDYSSEPYFTFRAIYGRKPDTHER
ncbi:hypothetical protein B0H66DRAFT_485257 [Apodospora peruviana]|uniref:Methyltransferase n=1 Tax=Apodospora peruviana TaxID=516989 RepID=A0AAE0HUA6_9PEZI|nr:hypothetical protein B0H66DRAFT_485257 [Apodospora peruviana]